MTSKLIRRLAFNLMTGTSLALLSFSAMAWPNKPIQLLVGFPAGGSVDVLARAFSDVLSRQLGQSAVVINRDGGARISSASVRSRPAAARPSRSVSSGIARSNGSSPTKPTTPGVSAASRLDSPPAEKPTSMILFIGAPKVPPARSEPTSAEMARALQRKSKVQGRSGVIPSTPASASATAWPASVRRLRVKPCEKIAAPRGVLAAG